MSTAPAKKPKKPPKPFNVAVGKRLLQIREAEGYGGHGKKQEFAKMLGIGSTALSNYESGERGLPPEVAAVFKEELSIPLDWIYLGVDGGRLPAETRARLPGRSRKCD